MVSQRRYSIWVSFMGIIKKLFRKPLGNVWVRQQYYMFPTKITHKNPTLSHIVGIIINTINLTLLHTSYLQSKQSQRQRALPGSATPGSATPGDTSPEALQSPQKRYKAPRIDASQESTLGGTKTPQHTRYNLLQRLLQRLWRVFSPCFSVRQHFAFPVWTVWTVWTVWRRIARDSLYAAQSTKHFLQ